MRTEPPPSLPCERAERPATCPAAAPPLEPPRGAGGVPGVAAWGTKPVLGRSLVAHLRRVGLAQNDGPGRPDSLRDHVVGVGDVVFEDEGAVSGADALGGVQVLDGYGNAVKRGQTVAPHHGRLGVLRPLDGHISYHGEVGVKL